MPTGQVQNPNAAFGLTVGDEQGAVFQTVKSAESSTAISGGDLVVLANSTSSGLANVTRATVGTAGALLYGVAVDNIAAGATGTICVYGPTKAARKNAGAVTAGNLLTRSSQVTAAVEVISAATAITQYGDAYKVIGVAVADATAGDTTVDIYVFKG